VFALFAHCYTVRVIRAVEPPLTAAWQCPDCGTWVYAADIESAIELHRKYCRKRDTGRKQ
jgi:hypothetical protein